MGQQETPEGGAGKKGAGGNTPEELAAASEKAEAALAEAADAVKEIEEAASEAASSGHVDDMDHVMIEENDTVSQPDERDEPDPEPLAVAADHDDDDEHEERHGSLAGKVLTFLTVALATVGLTLWGAPKIAPHVPASVAKYLTSPEQNVGSKVAALEAQLNEQAAGTSAALSAVDEKLTGLAEIEVIVAGATASAVGELETVLDAAKADAATARSEADALSVKVASIEAELEQARAEITALAAAMAERGDAAPVVVGATPEDLANLEQQREAAAALRSAEIAALAARVDALTGRVVEAETETEAAQDARNAALAEVETAVRSAELRGAAAALASRLASGESFAATLGDVEALSGTAAPADLAAGASTGFATPRALSTAFSPVARRAMAADIQAGADDTVKGRVLNWLQSQVAGRPTGETAGDDVGAVLSRVGARLDEGDATAALTETEALPAHSRDAMGGWLDQLSGRVAAENALTVWLTEIGVSG